MIEEDESQSTFAGREQRHGVWVLPFLLAGLFDRSITNDAGGASVGPEGPADGEAEARRLLRSLLNEHGDQVHDGEQMESDGMQDGSEKQEGEHMDSGRTTAGGAQPKRRGTKRSRPMFDCVAYRSAFGDTPVHAAVTALFAEYALLVGRITRHLGQASATPLTLSEGVAIAKQAQDFILGYVNPIMGPMQTTKFHRVLCHILHAVKCHGNILNASTSANESGHKQDKKHYVRTNKRRGFTRQLVRHAHGTRSVLKRNEEALKSTERAAHQDREASGNGGYAADSERSAAPRRRARVAHLPHVQVRELASKPGLSCIIALLGARDADRVAMPGQVFFTARLPHGPPVRQMLHASPLYYGDAWFDHVEYRPAITADGNDPVYGQVRVLVRTADGLDAAVVAEMDRVVGAEECPLSSRGCIQLRWAVAEGDAEEEQCRQVKLRLVPVKEILRVVHIVPDSAELACRSSIGVSPPSFGTSDERMWEMRYLLNAFLPDREQ